MHLAIQIIVIFAIVSCCHGSVGLLRDVLQFNLVGHPVLHKQSTWEFDPDVGKRRSRQYQELNGHLGEKAIERLGLGIDGYDQERLVKQQIRDEGHLNGLDDLIPPDVPYDPHKYDNAS